MTFVGNSAQRLGGAIGVDNVRVEEDLSSILNYNCFLQYNVGGEDENCPSNWKVRKCTWCVWVFSFNSYRLALHSIITQHPRDITCMSKILADVHPLLVILINPKKQLFMGIHCLVFQMFLRIYMAHLLGEYNPIGCI